MNASKPAWLFVTDATQWTIFIRLALAGVFIPEGIQ
jgi:hypothetical protein